jgi:peptidylprolyl isomerase
MSDPAPEPTPPRGLVKVIVEVVLLMLVLGAAGLIWATSVPRKPVSTSGIADLGTEAVASPTGLRWKDFEPGAGASPKHGQTVIVHYTGRLADGTVFDASREHGGVFKFRLGMGEVIKGWDEGVATMKPGGVRRLVVPPDLGYGSRGSGKIPPDSTLVFDIELLGYE